MDSYDVFVSYSREDGERALEVVRLLEAAGLSVRYDADISAGKPFREAIGQLVLFSGCVVVLWSRHSVESSWVLDEASLAKELGKLVQLRLGNSRLPLGFGQDHAPHLEALLAADSEVAWKRFVADVRSIVQRTQETSTIVVDPLAGEATESGEAASLQFHLRKRNMADLVLEPTAAGLRVKVVPTGKTRYDGPNPIVLPPPVLGDFAATAHAFRTRELALDENVVIADRSGGGDRIVLVRLYRDRVENGQWPTGQEKCFMRFVAGRQEDSRIRFRLTARDLHLIEMALHAAIQIVVVHSASVGGRAESFVSMPPEAFHERFPRPPSEQLTDAHPPAPAAAPGPLPATDTDEEFVARVRALLPREQPWPTGIHRQIAAQLATSKGQVSRAIQKLVAAGEFLPQIDGVVYVPRAESPRTEPPPDVAPDLSN